MAWEVDDIEATVEQLRARGVAFEDYDIPGLRQRPSECLSFCIGDLKRKYLPPKDYPT